MGSGGVVRWFCVVRISLSLYLILHFVLRRFESEFPFRMEVRRVRRASYSMQYDDIIANLRSENKYRQPKSHSIPFVPTPAHSS